MNLTASIPNCRKDFKFRHTNPKLHLSTELHYLHWIHGASRPQCWRLGLRRLFNWYRTNIHPPTVIQFLSWRVWSVSVGRLIHRFTHPSISTRSPVGGVYAGEWLTGWITRCNREFLRCCRIKRGPFFKTTQCHVLRSLIEQIKWTWNCMINWMNRIMFYTMQRYFCRADNTFVVGVCGRWFFYQWIFQLQSYCCPYLIYNSFVHKWKRNGDGGKGTVWGSRWFSGKFV